MRAEEIIHRVERQLLLDRAQGINGILQDNAIKLDRCGSRLSSLVTTTTTMEKCTDFINKVREFRFIKIRDRQVNKFNRLMGNKDKEPTTQPLAKNNQSQAQRNPDKWEVNSSSTPVPGQRVSFIKRTKLCNRTQNPPHLEYITCIESACQKLDHQDAEELRADINRVLRSSHTPKPNLTKEE